MRGGAVIAVAAVALAGAAPAAAQPDLWATVNVCDTPSHPSRMGVRGRMPGDGSHARMYVRFTVEYRDSAGKWQPMGGNGRSPWIYTGSALYKYQEAGFTFAFDRPQPGDRFELRGVANYRWRARRHVHGKIHVVTVRHEAALTAAGHPSTGADPPGYSAAECVIAGQ